MKSSKLFILILIFVLIAGCGGGSGGGGASPSTGTDNTSGGGGNTSPSAADKNVLSVTVNGALCSADSYPNKPCVSVTVCTPGTSTCRTINDILLDTGSYGLRIFKQALNISLTPVTVGSVPLAECIQFGDGSSDWGPIRTADVILGNEPAVEVPIQVIDSTFGVLPSVCQNADKIPSDAGFNGILGVGPFVHDCGSTCVGRSRNGLYYVCGGTTCSGTAVSLSSQVQNPVALLPRDNNGMIIQLPTVPSGGSPSIDGFLVLGIGTESNNMPSGATAYPTDQSANIKTTFSGISYTGFIDSGSNGLFFTAPSTGTLPSCASPNEFWFCPSSTVSLSATLAGYSGAPSRAVSFQIGNFDALTNSSNNVFAEIGGDGGGLFDWGLPFHFGRSVYMGMDGTSSSLGTGPYFAY